MEIGGSILSAKEIKRTALELGFDAVGIALAGQVKREERFLEWLERGFQGEMEYMARHRKERFDPRELLPGAKSIISVGLNYFPTEKDKSNQKGPYRVARYARGEDYHHIIRKKLQKLRSHLKTQRPGLSGRICVDTAPFMDKYWAEQAGLGWQGKHTNLLSRDFGNWLLIGSLVVDAVFDEYDRPHKDHCGKCRACIDACPTGAIVEPYCLDATRCISYWTIEAKGDRIPQATGKSMSKFVFGCDICLEVCPFNRFEKPTGETAFARIEGIDLIEEGRIDEIGADEFESKFANSPLKRPGYNGLKRNIRAASHTKIQKKK